MKGIMRKPWKTILIVAVLLAVVLCCVYASADDGEGTVSSMYGTFWSLLPPIIAIVLALITKEVYTSLFIGIVAGCLFYFNFNFEGT